MEKDKRLFELINVLVRYQDLLVLRNYDKFIVYKKHFQDLLNILSKDYKDIPFIRQIKEELIKVIKEFYKPGTPEGYTYKIDYFIRSMDKVLANTKGLLLINVDFLKIENKEIENINRYIMCDRFKITGYSDELEIEIEKYLGKELED